MVRAAQRPPNKNSISHLDRICQQGTVFAARKSVFCTSADSSLWIIFRIEIEEKLWYLIVTRGDTNVQVNSWMQRSIFLNCGIESTDVFQILAESPMGTSTDEYSQNQQDSIKQNGNQLDNCRNRDGSFENHHHIPTYKIISLKRQKIVNMGCGRYVWKIKGNSSIL